MKPQLFRHLVLGLTFAIAASAGAAQAQQYYRDPGGYGREGYDRGWRREGGIPQRVQNDLRRIDWRNERNWHERDAINRAMGYIDEFQRDFAYGRFDKHDLDRAIDNMKHAADHCMLFPPDREMLWRDINDLRAFRDSRGGYR